MSSTAFGRFSKVAGWTYILKDGWALVRDDASTWFCRVEDVTGEAMDSYDAARAAEQMPDSETFGAWSQLCDDIDAYRDDEVPAEVLAEAVSALDDLGLLDAPTYHVNDGWTQDDAPHTWDELEELCEAWQEDRSGSTPSELRELADGRVVDAAWDPASDPNPEVIATRNPRGVCDGW